MNISAKTYQTPPNQNLLSAELRSLINERNILTTKTRMKVLSALEDVSRDSSKLKQEEKERQLRSNAIQEILTSEASYLHQLETIMKFFMEPLKTKTYVSPAEWTALFGNIDTLYKVNGALLEELKSNPENVAAAFVKLAPYFKLYSVYAYDYKQICIILQEMHRNNARLAAFIVNQETRPEVGRKLSSLLITPIQRIPRYRLLLREVLSHTKPFQQDYYTLQSALREVEKTAEHINSLVQEQENMEKMIKVQNCLQHKRPGIITPGRKFIKEGVLIKVSANGRRPLPRYFILFSDMLIYCIIRTGKIPSQAESLRCCCVLPLKHCIVEPVLSNGVLRLSCYGETFILFSPCVDDTKQWLEALTLALKQYHANLQTLRKDSSSRRPLRHKDLHRAVPSSCHQVLPTKGSKRQHFQDEEDPGVAPYIGCSAVLSSIDTPDQIFRNCLPDCKPKKIRRLLPYLHSPQLMTSPKPCISHPLRSSLQSKSSGSSCRREQRVKVVTPNATDATYSKKETTNSKNKKSDEVCTLRKLPLPCETVFSTQESREKSSANISPAAAQDTVFSNNTNSIPNSTREMVSWSPINGIQSVGEILVGIHKALRRSLRRSLFRFTPELYLQ